MEEFTAPAVTSSSTTYRGKVAAPAAPTASDELQEVKAEVSAPAELPAADQPNPYGWDPATHFDPQVKAEALAAEVLAKQSPKAKASASSDPLQDIRGTVSPLNQHRKRARVALKPPSEKVQVIIISGLSGSGYEGYVVHVTKMLRNCGVATACLNTNLFLGFNGRPCSICKRAAQSRGFREVFQCTR